MKAPEHERKALLGIAIERATDELGAPIDRVDVTDSLVTCSAGSRKVVMSYSYADGGTVDQNTGRFVPTLGSGSWQVTVLDGEAVSQPEIIGRTIAKFLKSRGW